MQLNLEPNELDFIMGVLGELPTKSGAFILMQKIAAQVKAQQPTEEPKAE